VQWNDSNPLKEKLLAFIVRLSGIYIPSIFLSIGKLLEVPRALDKKPSKENFTLVKAQPKYEQWRIEHDVEP